METTIRGCLYIFLVFVSLTGMCQCKKNSSGNEIRMVDGSHASKWKQKELNNSCLCGSNSPRRSTHEGTCLRNWHEPGCADDNMRIISERLRILSPTFMVSSDKIVSELCSVENDIYVSDLNDLKLWALKMYDSSGKFTSGVLNGNINQFGDFDQCLNVENPTGTVRGKFCLAYLQINLKNEESRNKDIEKIVDLMLSHNIFGNTLNDSGHRVPRFSTIHWGLCVPSSCSHKEIESQLRDLSRRYTEGMDFEVEVRIDEEMCYIKKPFRLSRSFIIVSSIFVAVIMIVAVSTINDFLTETPNICPSFFQNLLNCFSLKRNFKLLISTEAVPDDISTIHGIRAINALLLLGAHKSLAIFFSPYSNRTYLAEQLSQRWSLLARIASLYTDSFILISGILTAYSYTKTLRKNGSLDIKGEYINRLIRILPLLVITVLLGTFIIPELGSGPFWGLTVENHSRTCKNTWWKNFLFIHNYFGVENMCFIHTHHLGIDTQLFFLSPFLVYILYKFEKIGIAFLISLAGLSTGWRYVTGVDKSLSYFIYPGITLRQMTNTANQSYILPHHRITVYIMGLITGYLLQCCGREFKINSHVRRICWMTTFILFSFTISLGTDMCYLGYVYDKYKAAKFNALAPVGWCLFLAWIIFASHINCGGIIGRILSLKYNMLWTRISFAVYLVQFPLFFYNVGRLRYSNEYSFISEMLNINEYAGIILASILVTLFFQMPINNIRKFLRQRKQLNHDTGKEICTEKEKNHEFKSKIKT